MKESLPSPKQMYAVIQNLLLNARDAIEATGRSDGQIKICLKRDNGAIIIEIIDNGVGIPENIKDKIFLPFFSTKPSKGMGLGMSECSKIISVLKGRIEIDSIPGETAIRVICPECAFCEDIQGQNN